jgi:hypothetical protein
MITRDVRRPWEILDDPATAELIDWSQPVAVLASSIMHFVKDAENPAEIVATFRDRMVSGSYFMISHATGGENPDIADRAADRGWGQARSQFVLRDAHEIEELFVGFEMIEPGLVSTTEWGTDDPAPQGIAVILAGLGYVP